MKAGTLLQRSGCDHYLLHTPSRPSPNMTSRATAPVIMNSVPTYLSSRPVVHQHHKMWLGCRAQTDTEESSSPVAPPTPSPPQSSESSNQQVSAEDNAQNIRVKKTISGLDALLGIVDEPPEPRNAWRAKSTTEETPEVPTADQIASGISKEALEKLTQADSSRSPGTSKPAGKDPIEEQFQRIIDKAKKLADEQNSSGGRANVEAEQANLRAEFETLLTVSLSDHHGSLRQSLYTPCMYDCP